VIAEVLESQGVDALVLVGGTEAYRTAMALHAPAAQEHHPALRLPVVCLPATIDNNVPGTDLSIGADTALNTIVEALDKLRTSASATRRCFVVETMGGPCGYLALMAGLAAGAERVYLPEEPITIRDLADDAERMTRAFQGGRRLWLAIRGEQATGAYSAELLTNVFEEEGGDLFDVRRITLGHVQTGADPTPFDRLLATRLARAALLEVERQLAAGEATGCSLGEVGGTTQITPVDRFEQELEPDVDRPRSQWWLDLRSVGAVVNDRGAQARVVALPTVVGR
jgi:6-phosphofructokinase 1